MHRPPEGTTLEMHAFDTLLAESAVGHNKHVMRDQQQQQRVKPSSNAVRPHTFLGLVVTVCCGLFFNCIFLLRHLSYTWNLDLSPTAVSPSSQHRLAVVVPTHSGDLDRALASLSRWPTVCSPVTLESVELVLYYAKGPADEHWSDNVLPELAQTAGTCFARTSAVFGNLSEEVSTLR